MAELLGEVRDGHRRGPAPVDGGGLRDARRPHRRAPRLGDPADGERLPLSRSALRREGGNELSDASDGDAVVLLDRERVVGVLDLDDRSQAPALLMDHRLEPQRRHRVTGQLVRQPPERRLQAGWDEAGSRAGAPDGDSPRSVTPRGPTRSPARRREPGCVGPPRTKNSLPCITHSSLVERPARPAGHVRIPAVRRVEPDRRREAVVHLVAAGARVAVGRRHGRHIRWTRRIAQCGTRPRETRVTTGSTFRRGGRRRASGRAGRRPGVRPRARTGGPAPRSAPARRSTPTRRCRGRRGRPRRAPSSR